MGRSANKVHEEVASGELTTGSDVIRMTLTEESAGRLRLEVKNSVSRARCKVPKVGTHVSSAEDYKCFGYLTERRATRQVCNDINGRDEQQKQADELQVIPENLNKNFTEESMQEHFQMCLTALIYSNKGAWQHRQANPQLVALGQGEEKDLLVVAAETTREHARSLAEA